MKLKKITAITLAVFFAAASSGCQILIEQDETVENKALTTTEASLPQSNYYYVWHNDYTSDYRMGQQSGYVENNVYTPVYLNYHSFEKSSNYRPTVKGKPDRLIWLDEEEIDLVPTCYEGDEVILRSDTYRPEEFQLERFFDQGWTFGIYGMEEDATGRYVIKTNLEDDDEKHTFFPLSEAFDMAKTLPDTTITIDKIGGNELRSANISASGFVSNLSKNNVYDLEVYVGTKAHNIQLKADSKPLVSMENFTLTEYSLENSYIAIIKLPSYLKTGYYLIDGVGIFRYIKAPYSETLSEDINYNDPIIKYDEKDNIIEDPSGQYIRGAREEEESQPEDDVPEGYSVETQ